MKRRCQVYHQRSAYTKGNHRPNCSDASYYHPLTFRVIYWLIHTLVIVILVQLFAMYSPIHDIHDCASWLVSSTRSTRKSKIIIDSTSSEMSRHRDDDFSNHSVCTHPCHSYSAWMKSITYLVIAINKCDRLIAEWYVIRRWMMMLVIIALKLLMVMMVTSPHLGKHMV